jgi:hypothetical protein
MTNLTHHHAFYLHHLGIERWGLRSAPSSEEVAFPKRLIIVMESYPLDAKATLLLKRMLLSIQLAPEAVLILSRADFNAQPSLLSPISVVLNLNVQHLLAHPADKKKAYWNLLGVKAQLEALNA